MKATKYVVVSLIILVFAYLFIINIIYSTNLENFINNNFSNNQINGDIEKIGISDSVEVTIQRNRWYGSILISEENKELYLFDFLKIPLEKNNKSYILSHIIFISVWFMILIITLILNFVLKNIKKLEN